MINLLEKLKSLPKQPGVYQFLNKDGEVIYIGKAKDLKSRVSQYFQGNDNRPQIPFLMREAKNFDYTIVNNELESIYLENTLIKQYRPKYNILLRDDKNYAFIKIDYSTQIPQIGYARKIDSSQKSNVTGQMSKYFGPYTAAYKIRNTLNLIRKIFPFCSAEKISSRPCFYYYLHRCPGVCIGKISLTEYHKTLEKITEFLNGNVNAIVKSLTLEMQNSGKHKKFEQAASYRDQLKALQMLQEKQTVILPKKVDWDLVSINSDQGYSCVNLFKIRSGKLFDKENFVYEIPELNFSEIEDKKNFTNELLEQFLETYYSETNSFPKTIFLQQQLESNGNLKQIILQRHGRKIELIVPQKGKLKNLIRLGQTNAEQYLKNWLSDQAGNLDKINRSLEELKNVLKLQNIPVRIECYDISNTQGTNAVGSMVVFQDGLPKKSEYRKFKIRTKQTPDDFAMMKEMLTRRFARSSQQSAVSSQLKQWPLPDLIVIDGGKGQLNAALEVPITYNLQLTTIPIIGLAKRIEEIFIPGSSEPIILPHDNTGLQLLQRLRDETHRFGITFHRQLRSKQAVKSALDEIPGIGPKTKKLLKQKFGTVAEIKKAGFDKLALVVGEAKAKVIQTFL